SKAQIKSIEEWINNYPRGIHAGHSALDVKLIVKRSFAAGKHMIYIAFIAQKAKQHRCLAYICILNNSLVLAQLLLLFFFATFCSN
ncbi:hypothetical protein CJ205_07455, partial [Dolosicoccus paucivorans]